MVMENNIVSDSDIGVYVTWYLVSDLIHTPLIHYAGGFQIALLFEN